VKAQLREALYLDIQDPKIMEHQHQCITECEYQYIEHQHEYFRE